MLPCLDAGVVTKIKIYSNHVLLLFCEVCIISPNEYVVIIKVHKLFIIFVRDMICPTIHAEILVTNSGVRDWQPTVLYVFKILD